MSVGAAGQDESMVPRVLRGPGGPGVKYLEVLVGIGLSILLGLAAGCSGGPPIATGPVSGSVEEEPAPVSSTSPLPTQTPVPTSVPSPPPIATPTPSPVPTRTPERPELTPTPAQRVDLGSGRSAPQLAVTLFNGEELRLSDLKGKVVVLNFWASWCPPCRWEMPAFERMWQEYRDQGVVFVGVAISDAEEDAQAFARKIGVTYPVGLDATGRAARDFRVFGLPTTFLIDRDGNEARKFGVANEAILRIFLKGQLEAG